MASLVSRLRAAAIGFCVPHVVLRDAPGDRSQGADHERHNGVSDAKPAGRGTSRLVIPPVPLLLRVLMSGVLVWVSGRALDAAAWVTPELPR